MKEPQLAKDGDTSKIILPAVAEPKIDGVRGWNPYGQFVGRSMDPFSGHGITEHFSRPEYLGLDGELTLGDDPTAERLCSLTTGATSKFVGVDKMADMHWWLFDYVLPETMELTYLERYDRLASKVWSLRSRGNLHLVPFDIVRNQAELDSTIARHLDLNYEGTCTRNPHGRIKEGRPTKLQELWRFKPWGDFEILVTSVTEGQRNANEQKTNSRGRTERSSAKAGMIPNGQVGSITGILLDDVYHKFNGRLLFRKGETITAGSGEMTVEEAIAWFIDQTQIVGHIAKIKHMMHGVKDKPRFPTFVSKRSPTDMPRKKK